MRDNPKNDGALFNRGINYRDSKDCVRAIDDFSRSIELDPQFALTYVYRGFCYEQVKQTEAALADYNRAIAIDPRQSDALNNRAVLAVARGDYKIAIRDLTESLKYDPDNAVAWFNRGFAHRENGELDLAVLDFGNSLKRDPRKSDSDIERGIVLARLGQEAEAIADLKRSLQIDPRSERATHLIAQIQAKLNSSTPPARKGDGAAAPLPAEKRVALVIGNAEYTFLTKLRNSATDAEELAKALRGLGFDVIEGRNLGRNDMQNALRDFGRKLEGASLALLFDAGHGLQMNGRSYLVPTDVKYGKGADLTFDAIDVTQAIAMMEGDKRTSLIFLDARGDNQSTRGGGATQAPASGLAAIRNTAGTLIAYSSQPDSAGLDGAGRHSPFAAALLKNFSTPGLEIEALMKQVRLDVIAATQGSQVPWGHSSLVSDVYLNKQ